jgi:hypothetical protein
MRARPLLLLVPLALGASCARGSAAPFDSSGGDAGDAGIDRAVLLDSTAADTSVIELDARPEATGPTANLRIANWSPDAPTSGYDVCLAPHGTSTWRGPLLARMVGDAGVLGDSGSPSIQFPLVTNYLLGVSPGTYDAAIVATGAGCANPVAMATNLPALAVSGWYTMAIVGDRTPAGADPALSVVVLTDDSSATIGAAVRFLDMAPSIASADFGEGTLAAGFVPLAIGVPFAKVATRAAGDAGAKPDANGYVAVMPPSGAALSAHASSGATGDAAVAPNQTFAAGAVVTVALVGGKTGAAKPQLVVCSWDGVVDPSAGLYSGCISM